MLYTHALYCYMYNVYYNNIIINILSEQGVIIVSLYSDDECLQGSHLHDGGSSTLNSSSIWCYTSTTGETTG